MNFNSVYDYYLNLFNDYVLKKLDCSAFSGRESDGFYKTLESITYSITNGGKRIRPILTLEFCRVCGGNPEDALPFALAVEMIHTYSLIHDDLPCMDDDDLRRGKPSNHIVYGYADALLAGDGLQALAFETIVKSSLSADKKCAAVSLLADAAGPCGMVAGQVMDLHNENKYVSVDDIKNTDYLKTGKLIIASGLMGAVCAGAGKDTLEAVHEYCANLGQCFQIVDDILDITGDEKKLGKPVGSDEESGKSTYVSILGVDEASKMAKYITGEAVKSLTVFGEEAWFLEELAAKLLYREK